MRLITLTAALLIAGCQTDSPLEDLLEGRKIDYEADESQAALSLQYPPDLLSTTGGIEGTVSLSEYTVGSVPIIEEQDIAPEELPAAKVRYRRSGNLRWIEADLTTNEAWGIVRRFWSERVGFELEKEDGAIGTMETGWLDLRERLATPGWLGTYVDRVLNRLNDSGHRDKFVIRLEGNETGGTDIFVAHRYAVARFDGAGAFTGFEPAESDAQLEIEMMRRIMLYMSQSDEAAEEDATDIEGQIADEESNENLQYRHEGATLRIARPFYESWQIAQVGLNRGGFTIQDRDYQEGVIYIRHSGGPDTDKIFGKVETTDNFFNRLFGEEQPILRDIKLIFHNDTDSAGNEGVYLTAEAVDESDALSERQAGVILELLYEYLP